MESFSDSHVLISRTEQFHWTRIQLRFMIPVILRSRHNSRLKQLCYNIWGTNGQRQIFCSFTYWLPPSTAAARPCSSSSCRARFPRPSSRRPGWKRAENEIEVIFTASGFRVMLHNYRDRLKGLYVVARNFFLLLLNFSAWPCLAVA